MNHFQPSVVIIGAGNRANKYMEYIRRHPESVRLVGVVDPVEIRRESVARDFGLKPEECYASYEEFFARRVAVDAVMICTPEDKHFKPCMMAIDAGYNVLLEKPIAQTKEQCEQIMIAAQKRGVVVGVCHVLRYHPYFKKIKEVVSSGELGRIISINHSAGICVDRMAHSYVRGYGNQVAKTNPMLVAKCCHDIDFLLWICGQPVRKVSSFGSLRWFRECNAPHGSALRCVDCAEEERCPYSAVDLYRNRKQWVANFDVPQGMTLDEVIEDELQRGAYGRCVYHCDNTVVDHQIVNLELADEVTISFAANAFTRNDFRLTHIELSGGEINGDERLLRIRSFRGEEQVIDFSHLVGEPFHAGADLNIVEAFLQAIHPSRRESMLSSVSDSIDSHIVCFEAERSRLSGQTINL